MHAAVLHTIGGVPRYEEFPEPVIADKDGELLVHVQAASLKPDLDLQDQAKEKSRPWGRRCSQFVLSELRRFKRCATSAPALAAAQE